MAITISPPNRITIHNHWKDPNTSIYIDDKQYINQVFKYAKIKHYMIYPEFDDKGRLHYHGIVTLTNTEYIRFRKYVQPKLTKIGFVDTSELLTFKHNLRYLYYCTKQFHEAKQILNINTGISGISLTQTNRTKSAKSQQNSEKNLLDFFHQFSADI